MKKNLLFHFCCPVLVFLLATFTARATVTVNSTNFPDANFRAAVALAAGVSQNGGTFAEASLTTLDVSGKNITSLKGLELLTGLTSLNVSNNTLSTGADLRSLTALTTLKASHCNITTLAAVSRTSPHAGAGLFLGTGNQNILYLDLSENADFYYSGNLQYLTKMETLLLNGCTGYDYWNVAPGAAMRSIKWLDISNTACNRIYLPNATGLKHLKAANTLLRGFSSSASYSGSTPDEGFIQIPVGLTTLEYLNLANCPNMVYFQAINGHYHVASLDTLILTNDTNLGWSNNGFEPQTGMTYLDVTNCAISTAGPNYVPNFDNLKNLETLLYGENPDVGYLRITGNSHLKVLDLHGDTGLTMLALDNCGLPRSDLAINDTNCPAFTGLKLNNNGYGSVGQAMANVSVWGLDHIQFLYLQNNSGFTGGPLTLAPADCGGLTGLDLGRNGFTSFSAPELPSSLTALMLGNNTGMTRLEMHNNPGITTMTADTVMRDGSGLYLLGNSALTYMDISGTDEQPNYFQRIGNNFSLQGVPIDTLKASHNKFYTFRNLTTVSTREGWETYHKTNLVYGWQDFDPNLPNNGLPNSNIYFYGVWPPSPAQPDSASLEQLTALRYLDLSYCHLKDSVHLHKNRDLRYLDLSHNRVIHRYYEPRNPPKGAAYRAYYNPDDHTVDKRTFEDYKIFLWLKDEGSTGLEEFTGDYNDTIGLYNLDLVYNNELEYLDISYTGIEQTAANHCYVTNPRFIWIQDLPKLKYFYADYNGMRSLGTTTKNGRYYREGLKSLERLSAIGMRGSDDKTMMGSINYKTIDPNKDSNPSPLVNLHYINLSYSSYDSIGVYNELVDTLIIRGNPIHYLNVDSLPLITYVDARESAFKMRGYDPETGRTYAPSVSRFKNGARRGGYYNASSTNDFPPSPYEEANGYPVRSPFSGLRGVLATYRPELTTLMLDSCNALTNVYAHHNPKLPKIHGFEHLAYPKPLVDAQFGYSSDTDSLTLVWVNDNAVFSELNLTQNVNLQYLHAYNDKALGTALGNNGMQLNENVILKTAWVSNSLLKRFTNNAGEHLDTLKIWDNPQLQELDVTQNTKLKWFDLRNCQVRYLDMEYCDSLMYFDCSNDSIKGQYRLQDWFGYQLPRAVPVPPDLNLDADGKNRIADLQFSSKKLKTVKADNNDLYSLRGLNGIDSLKVLTYSHNHINAIDLSGSPNIQTYNADHNGRGAFPAEYAKWLVRNDDNSVDTCHMYYLQLVPDAGDELDPIHHDSYLGYRWGSDSLLSEGSPGRERVLDADGFDPNMVAAFDVNASGPYEGNRDNGQSLRGQVVVNSGSIPDPDLIYGQVVVLDITNNPYNPDYHYIEYEYYDGRRPPGSRDSDEPTKTRYYLVWYSPGEVTEAEETLADDLGEVTVVSERYFDINGRELSEPTSGVNFIVKQMSDGTTQTVKVLK